MMRRSTVFGRAERRALPNELKAVGAEAFIPVRDNKDLDSISVVCLVH
jgi:hypothetical protein